MKLPNVLRFFSVIRPKINKVKYVRRPKYHICGMRNNPSVRLVMMIFRRTFAAGNN